MVAAPGIGMIDSLARLARSGDEIASILLGSTMDTVRTHMDYGRLVEFYGDLTQTFVATNNVRAARFLANQLRIDGYLSEALTLLVWAANRGEFLSLSQVPQVAMNLALGISASVSERALFFVLARRKTFDHHDPGAAFWLGCCFLDPSWCYAIDIVAGIRMLRMAMAAELRLDNTTAFGGETLWTSDRFYGTFEFELLHEAPIPPIQLFHLLLVPLTSANWAKC